MEMNFYNHVNKGMFKNAGQGGTFETQPIHSEICLVHRILLLAKIIIIVNHDGLNTWCSENTALEPCSTNSLVTQHRAK